MSLPIALGALFALVALMLGNIIYYRYLHPLSKYPGPFLASITNLWKVRELLTEEHHRRLVKYHETYGPIVRIGPNDLSFNGADAIAPIYKSGGKLMPKGDAYNAFVAIVPNMFATTNEPLHSLRRRQLAHGFSAQSLRSMEDIFNNHITHLIDRIDTAASTNTPIDLKDAFAFYTYDLTSQLAFDSEFNTQIAHDPAELPPIDENFYLGNLYACIPDLVPYIKPLTGYIPWVRRLQKGRMRVVSMARGFVQHASEHHKQSDSARTLLTSLLNAKDAETGATLSLPEINSEAFSFLLTILFAHLFQNPTVLDAVVKEIDTQLETATTDSDIYDFTGLEAKLPYTTACLREGFRIDPIAAFLMPRRVTNPEGLQVCDEVIPQGTNCVIPVHVLHHNPSIWGPDHNTFNPQRFMPDSPSYDPSRVNMLMHFGMGHRACIGRNIALMSMYKIITSLLKTFRFDVVAEDGRELEGKGWKTVSHGLVEKETPLRVRVVSRKGISSE